jgi:trehalose 6-phosphate phosphatase
MSARPDPTPAAAVPTAVPATIAADATASGMAIPEHLEANFSLAGLRECSLFLDFDGTLVELAATPEAVRLAPNLIDILSALQERLDGRLAIVTGRPIEQIDQMLAPLRLAVAGVHGAERRGADGRMHCAPAPSMLAAQLAAQRLVTEHPQLIVEEKRGALALHFRQAPELEALCKSTMTAALQECPGMVLMHGKMVLEMKPAGSNKGTALHDFMQEAPFAGHRPLFAGDDTTDEAGFAYAQEIGGVGIKIGGGPSIALNRLASTAALLAVLVRLAGIEAPAQT